MHRSSHDSAEVFCRPHEHNHEHDHDHSYGRPHRPGRSESDHERHEHFHDDYLMDGHGEDALATKMRLVSDRLMRSGGRMRGQERILDVLSKEGDIPQRDLGHILHIQPGSLSEIPAKLEDRGLIAREQDRAYHRIIMVRITEEGKNQTGIEGEDKKMDFFSSLTEEEKKTLADLLDKLIRESDASHKD